MSLSPSLNELSLHPAQVFTLTTGHLLSASPCAGTLFTSSRPWHPVSGCPLHGVLFTELRLCPFVQTSPPLILPHPALYSRNPSSPEVRLCFYGDALFILLALQCPAPDYVPTQTFSSPLDRATNSPLWTPSYTWSGFSPALGSVAFPSPPSSPLHFVELFSSFLMLVGS